MKTFTLLIALLLASTASAQEIRTAKPNSGIAGVALGAAAGLRTFTITRNDRFTHLRIGYLYTKGASASATTLTLTCEGTLDNGANWISETSTSISGGVGTGTAYSDSIAVSASSNFSLAYDVRGYDRFRCVASGTGTLTTHLITIQLALTAGF